MDISHAQAQAQARAVADKAGKNISAIIDNPSKYKYEIGVISGVIRDNAINSTTTTKHLTQINDGLHMIDYEDKDEDGDDVNINAVVSDIIIIENELKILYKQFEDNSKNAEINYSDSDNTVWDGKMYYNSKNNHEIISKLYMKNKKIRDIIIQLEVEGGGKKKKKEKYVSTKKKIKIMVKKKPVERTIYINSRKTKFVKVDKCFELLSKFKKI